MLAQQEDIFATLALLEDDPYFADRVSQDLTQMGCQISHFRTGEDCIKGLQEKSVDLCLFDLQLPGISGLEVMTRLSALGRMPPVIFLTSNDSEEDIARILLAGADDYIIKPHNANILKARIKALLRRTRHNTTPPQEHLGALTIDHAAQKIFLDGQLVKLTSMETTLAFALLQQRGQIVSRQSLYKVLDIDDMAVDTRRLDVHLSRIRSKLQLNVANGWTLSSVYQRGYRIEYFHEK
ncbi:MAG: response regulator transcription factor [Pseudomonadota bacterium]|jgi:DNA-binding response OmpR family regulator